MNSGVITKVEYRILPEVNFSQLDVIPQSGKFNEDPQKTGAGMLYSFSAGFNIAKLNQGTDEIISNLTDRKAQFRITDANGTRHLAGDDSYPARLYASRHADGQPGSFNGYRCSITRKAPEMTATED